MSAPAVRPSPPGAGAAGAEARLRRRARFTRRRQGRGWRYLDDRGRTIRGPRRARIETDLNAYLKEEMGEDFSAKDFRTWAGTAAAAVALDEVCWATGPPSAARATSTRA